MLEDGVDRAGSGPILSAKEELREIIVPFSKITGCSKMYSKRVILGSRDERQEHRYLQRPLRAVSLESRKSLRIGV